MTEPMGTADSKKGIADAVRKGLRRRYAKEMRFKFYGLAAIAFAMLTLVVLFTTIISSGIGAFVQSKVTLDVTFSAEDIDASDIGAGNFRSIAFDALRKEFPSAPSGRKSRPLTELLSSGAPFQLRQIALEDPGVVGTTRQVEMTFSDDADIFLKGKMTAIEDVPVTGIGSIIGTDGEVKILSTANDFSAVLADVKRSLGDLASAQEREVRRAERRLGAMESELSALQTRLQSASGDAAAALQERVEALQNDIAAVTHERDQAQIKAVDLRNRAGSPGGPEPTDSSMPSYLVAINNGLVKITSVDNAQIIGETIVALESDGDVQGADWRLLKLVVPEDSRRLTDKQIGWLWTLEQRGKTDLVFNTTLFSAGDSREPELAGIWGAAVGSFWTLLVTLSLSFPIGVMAAVYLEEFAPKNRWTDIIEVNINNLAAVPSIVFGLLGLALFLNVFGLPRSAPLVGGLVLTLMTLPTIIIASRAALKSVPPSIREAALGMGASRLQAMTHHVLPLALPGMLTGTIIGMAQALGETAPLLMIGMVAFIVDVPGGPTDPATVLPVQIFLWADAPERAFVERTSAAIMVLLAFLITMNLTAVLLRKKFETRW